MRSDVPIGTALSGGLDSSATICSMAHLARTMPEERMGKSWQHAFVASFPGTPLDETQFAKRVTDFLDIPATFIDVDPSRSVGDLERQLYMFEDVYITSPIPFMKTYEAVKSSGISVTLDGHGADELFGGYTFDYVVALGDAGLNLRRAIEIVDTFYAAEPTGTPQFADLPNRWRFLAEWHARRFARAVLRRRSAAAPRDQGHPNWTRLDKLSRQLYVSTHETILPTLLRNYDRYSMANGVEIRMPFLDHRIVAFSFALPWSAKIRCGHSKAIVREALADFMPAEIAWRRSKIGFNSPIVDWMKGPLKGYLLDTLASDGFVHCELIEPAKVDAAVRFVIETPDARFEDGERAWSMLSPYLWQKAFLRGGRAPTEIRQ
jgi:asparagine synthase (glutamine-hydrolysing)